MTTREIPREKWKEFFEGFSRRHEGWLVDVETLGAGGARPDARQSPLDGIAESPDGDRIEIRFGASGGSHEIPRPRRIDVEEDRGAERALRIRSESGESTRLSFRSALPPEMVDGILPE
jgi:Family of unknown function (DUF5335)